MSCEEGDPNVFRYEPFLARKARQRIRRFNLGCGAGVLLSVVTFAVGASPLAHAIPIDRGLILMAGMMTFIFSVMRWCLDDQYERLSSSDLITLQKIAARNPQVAVRLSQWIEEGRTVLWRDMEAVQNFDEACKQQAILSGMQAGTGQGPSKPETDMHTVALQPMVVYTDTSEPILDSTTDTNAAHCLNSVS